MDHITDFMPLLNVRFVPSAIKPVRTRLQVTPMDYSDLKGGILSALKRTRAWMTYAEVADAVLATHKLTLDPPRYRHFLKMRGAAFCTRMPPSASPMPVFKHRHPARRGYGTQATFDHAGCERQKCPQA